MGEYEGTDSVHEVAFFIGEHGELGAELLGYYRDIDDARKAIEQGYCGCHASVADYAQELTEETGDVPSHLECILTMNAWDAICS